MTAVRFLFVLFIWTTPALLLATSHPEPEDLSQAGTDGPHVFYRGDKILVKYVVMRDTGAKAVTENTIFDIHWLTIRLLLACSD